MSLQSDLVFNFSKVDTKTISEQTKKLNDILEEKSQSGPSWWEVRNFTNSPVSNTGELADV